jgi:inositol phosphorylceramide mannosyltransferase catalytic subunit
VKNAPQTIPNRIIQTGKTRKLQMAEQAAVSNLTSLNPGFAYTYFDDEDVETFINREFPEYRNIYDGFPHRIQRFDFFRYLAVYRFGGFYFDLDVLLARGIENLTSSSCVFPFEELTLNSYLRTKHGIDWEIGNYAFGASPGHPFLRAIIDNCVRAQQDRSWVAPMMSGVPFLLRPNFEILNTTGPGLVTRTLAEHPELVPTVNILFPTDVCDSSTWHHFGDYGVHLMTASWHAEGNFITRRLAQFCENRTRHRLRAESLQLGKERRYPIATSIPI